AQGVRLRRGEGELVELVLLHAEVARALHRLPLVPLAVEQAPARRHLAPAAGRVVVPVDRHPADVARLREAHLDPLAGPLVRPEGVAGDRLVAAGARLGAVADGVRAVARPAVRRLRD